MQEKTLRTIGAAVVLAGVVIAGVAQAGSAEEREPAEIAVTTSVAEAVDTTQAPTSSSAEEPFVYRLGVLSGISTDNFWAYYAKEPSVWNSYILGPTTAALYTLDPRTAGLTPELATGDVQPVKNPDGWSVIVPLRDDFEWSDGTPITAGDFVFTFETVRSLGLGGSWRDAYPKTIESITADEGDLLHIHFTERPNLAVWPNGVGLAPVMPEHVWASVVADGNAKELYSMPGNSDVSGGRLTLVNATDEVITSHANPGYPSASTPDVVEYHVYSDEAALVSAVVNGEVDSILTPKGLTQEQVSGIEDMEDLTVIDNPANGVRYLGFNLEREPMIDSAFRQALAYLVDREQLAATIPGTGDAAWSLIPRANARWFDETQGQANRALYDGDLGTRLAKALGGLRDSGYAWTKEPTVSPDGDLVAGEGLTIDGRQPQPLTILTAGDAYDPERPEYVQRIADILVILGFDARPVETDFDSVVDQAFTTGDDGELHYDMYMLGWTLGNPTLPDFYRHLFTPKGAMNNTGYSSKRFNRALADYEGAHSIDEASKALWKMERVLAKDLPYLLLYTTEVTEVYRNDRVTFGVESSLGGLQGRLGGIGDVEQVEP